MDSRDYGSYYFILGTYNDHGAYLSSYKKLDGILPLYERDIIAANQDDDLTGIGVPLHERYIDLLIAPPYADILIRAENGVLCPAPEGAYLSSYKKLYGILPLYERDIIAANQDDDLTGIGVPLHGRYIDLLIAPPYTDILIRSENGVLCPAPETMY